MYEPTVILAPGPPAGNPYTFLSLGNVSSNSSQELRMRSLSWNLGPRCPQGGLDGSLEANEGLRAQRFPDGCGKQRGP